MIKKKRQLRTYIFILIIYSLSAVFDMAYAQEQAPPVIVDGDTVEYAADEREVTAQGNVVVTYGDAQLTCDKLVVNTETKEVEATGGVRLREPRGILEAEKLIYNLQTKKGNTVVAKLRSSPYYYFGKELERAGEDMYIVKDGYFSSCNYNNPHFRIKSKRVKVIPDDKIVAYSNTAYWTGLPLFYFPRYSHSLKDPFMKVQFKAGKSSAWGPYMLSAWRSDLNDNANLRLYLDWRYRLGAAEGFGLNYDTKIIGRGDFKFYYTQERPDKERGTPRAGVDSLRKEFQRYLVRFRHMWDIDPSTRLIAQYYRIEDERRKFDSDADFLRDYFVREYERDSQPKTYALLTHALPSANISMIAQKRTVRWYGDMTEKLPEIFYDIPNLKIAQTPLYLQNQTKFSNLAKKYTAPSALDDDVVRFDTYNRLTLPHRIMFIQASPYVAIRETAYTKDENGNSLSPRTAFYAGIDISTKFYRIFDVDTNFMGLDINGLRHIVTPMVKYGYIHEPTVSSSVLQDFGDDIDTIDGDNRFTLELENKLQTKRKGSVADLAIFRITTDYVMYSRKDTISKGQDRFTDFLFDLELTPFAWLRMEADATYDHRNDYFKTANFDNWFNIAKGRSIGIGHRYERGAGKEMTSQLNWKINPKWNFRFYSRYQFARTGDYRAGLREQEYVITRDLHCAVMELAFNRKKSINAKTDNSFWVKFDLKIFKESEFDYVKSYHPPKATPSP